MFQKHKMNYQPIPLPYRAGKSNAEMKSGAEAFYTEIKQRHTVRDYSTQSVELSVIQTCIKAAGLAPSGANHQPWHFVAISDENIKRRIREAAEDEERKFYAGGDGDEWIKALEPIGTGPSKSHLEDAPWLIVIIEKLS